MSFSYQIHSMRFKLIASMIAVSMLIGLIALVVGVNLIYRSVLDEAKNRIHQDLNVARVIYDERIDSIRLALETSAYMPGMISAMSSGDLDAIALVLKGLSRRFSPGFMGVTDSQGRVVFRLGASPGQPEPGGPVLPFVEEVIEDRKTCSGTLVMNLDDLIRENPALEGQARIPAQGGREAPATGALVVGAAVPVWSGDTFSGVLYGGFLLNKDTAIVDKIGETVFKNEMYQGRNTGTATIFCSNLRIATSVKDTSGNRVLGTTASEAVTRRVLGHGIKWTDRAWVFDNWYITAYEPIHDIFEKRVGMLYVGVLEAQYAPLKRHALTVFTGITLAGLVAACMLGWLITSRIMRPVNHLIRASAEISKGNFSPDIGPISKDDIGQLQRKFLIMVEALKAREKSQKVESEIRLIQSEKQASVGKLAAGVAHEINNPLTAVLTFTHMILRRKDLPEDVRADLETVTVQTERVRKIVKSLLDFSRQTVMDPEPIDVNAMIEECVNLLSNQALIKGVHLAFIGETELPRFTLDRHQFQSVLINMIINALDATPPGGFIRLNTWKASVNNESGVNIVISDTGCGIEPVHMDRLFDPFFTTKEVGKGTGLGLAVSEGIIHRHGGTIHVRSTPGSGTTFTLWLPHKNPETLRKDPL